MGIIGHFQSKNDVDGALNKYKLINVSTEDSCELWSNIGLCFLKKRKFVAVSTAVTWFVLTNASNIESFWTMVHALQAIACLKKSVWMSPLNFNCVFNLAMALLTGNRYQLNHHQII